MNGLNLRARKWLSNDLKKLTIIFKIFYFLLFAEKWTSKRLTFSFICATQLLTLYSTSIFIRTKNENTIVPPVEEQFNSCCAHCIFSVVYNVRVWVCVCVFVCICVSTFICNMFTTLTTWLFFHIVQTCIKVSLLPTMKSKIIWMLPHALSLSLTKMLLQYRK